jgi:lipopolysaccharide/colanic/teichoic acid biosynthesis glycosyltransferase
MNQFNKREPLILLLGDIFFFLVSLWLTLLLRNVEPPTSAEFALHLLPFSILFAVWVVVFYIAGLYEKHTVILQKKLPNILGAAQLTNSALAVIFFYLVPFFGITPKTILFIYLIVSFILILFWRTHGYFALGSRRANNAILIGAGEEMKELLNEVNNNPIYSIHFVSSIDLDKVGGDGFWSEVISRVYSEGVSVLPHLYNLIFSRVDFIDMHKIYEDIFDRVPLSLLRYNWFLENISATPRTAYDALKRLMDILISLPLLIVPLIALPLAFVAVKFEDGGPVFTHQNRVGQNNKTMRLLKFRTMLFNDDGDWKNSGRTNKVTKVGNFLRKTRLDEFPQLWNVLIGDISLIGPRPEFPDAVKHYTEGIPYYNVRHIIKPGLSGWAQIYGEDPHHGIDLDKTKNKLSYDLYYIKNRSFFLDLKIALRTLKTLATITGR